MIRKEKHQHIIDYLFPVILFFLFTLSALTVLLLAANVYQSTVKHSSLNDSSETALSYVAEKIHQYDSNGAISIGTFDGQDALILTQSHDDQDYITYIYAYNNELKELFIKEGTTAKASAGETILETNDFSMEQLTDTLFRFQCADASGNHMSTIIAVRTAK